MIINLYNARLNAAEREDVLPETVAYEHRAIHTEEKTLTPAVVDELVQLALNPALELEEYDYAELAIMVRKEGKAYSDGMKFSFTSVTQTYMSDADFLKHQIGKMADRLNRAIEAQP